jgi:hypothetical protein
LAAVLLIVDRGFSTIVDVLRRDHAVRHQRSDPHITFAQNDGTDADRTGAPAPE